MSTHILLINCPDDKGLVYTITGILLEYQVNIIQNDEFVEPESRSFFMRTVFEGNIEEAQLLAQLSAKLPENAEIRLSPQKNKDIVVFASREFHCLGDLLIRHQYDKLNANILAVISNHKNLQPLVGAFGIPFHYIAHKDKTREAHEELVLKTLSIYEPEYLVLAKYMRILNQSFVSHYPNKIINIHHSFLPAFIGARPYHQAYDRGVKIIGATAHFVNEELDQGPIIAQEVTPVNHRLNAKAMTQEGNEIEKLTLAKALKLVFQDRVFVHGNKTIIF